MKHIILFLSLICFIYGAAIQEIDNSGIISNVVKISNFLFVIIKERILFIFNLL